MTPNKISICALASTLIAAIIGYFVSGAMLFHITIRSVLCGLLVLIAVRALYSAEQPVGNVPPLGSAAVFAALAGPPLLITMVLFGV